MTKTSKRSTRRLVRPTVLRCETCGREQVVYTLRYPQECCGRYMTVVNKAEAQA